MTDEDIAIIDHLRDYAFERHGLGDRSFRELCRAWAELRPLPFRPFSERKSVDYDNRLNFRDSVTGYPIEGPELGIDEVEWPSDPTVHQRSPNPQPTEISGTTLAGWLAAPIVAAALAVAAWKALSNRR